MSRSVLSPAVSKKEMFTLPNAVTVTIPCHTQLIPLTENQKQNITITAADTKFSNNTIQSSLHSSSQILHVQNCEPPNLTSLQSGPNQKFHNANINLKNIGQQLDNGKWKCALCPSTYKHKPHLARHMFTHSGQKPFTCNYCNKQYFRKDNYQIHLKSHSIQKPFVCAYCNKEFLRKNNFERHIRLHTGEKPYACPYCLHRSIRKDTLEGHIYRNHTRDLKNIDKDDDLSSSDEES